MKIIIIKLPLTVQASSVEVKIEQFVRDNHDDYMDLDLSLALSNVEETFNDVGKL